MLGEQFAQRRRACGGEADAGRVLSAGCADHGSHTGIQSGTQASDSHALIVHGHRDGPVPAEAHRMDAGEEARVLQGHGVIAHQRLGEQALDSIDGTAGDRDAEIRCRQIACDPGSRPGIQARIDHGLAVQHRSAHHARQHRRGIGDQGGIRIAGADIAQHGVRGEALLCDGVVLDEHGARPAAADDDAGL